MQRRCPNITKICEFSGFEPKYDLEAMIRSVIEYFKERPLNNLPSIAPSPMAHPSMTGQQEDDLKQHEI